MRQEVREWGWTSFTIVTCSHKNLLHRRAAVIPSKDNVPADLPSTRLPLLILLLLPSLGITNCVLRQFFYLEESRKRSFIP